MSKVGKGNQSRRENQIEEKSSSSNGQGNPLIQLLKIFSKFSQMITNAFFQMVKGMTNMLNSLYKKLLSTILRSAFAVMLVSFPLYDFIPNLVRVHTFYVFFNEPTLSAKSKYTSLTFLQIASHVTPHNVSAEIFSNPIAHSNHILLGWNSPTHFFLIISMNIQHLRV